MATVEDEFRQDLAERPTKFVFVVGSGVPMGAVAGQLASLASWTGLLKAGLVRAHEIQPFAPLTLASYQQLLASPDDTTALVSVATAVTQRLGAPTGGPFRLWLRNTVGAFADNLGDVAVLDAIALHQKRGVIVATTNYDHALERRTGLTPTTWRDVNGLQRAISGTENRIIHLHGEWSQPDSIILDQKSYSEVLRDPAAQTALASLRWTSAFVFIGCGAGLSDPNRGGFIKWSAEKFPDLETRPGTYVPRQTHDCDAAELVRRHCRASSRASRRADRVRCPSS